MKNYISQTDTQYIRHILGRMPSDDELNVIAKLQTQFLKGRLYIETLNRLDDGIKRTRIPEEDLTDENGKHIYFYSSLYSNENAIEDTESLLEVESRTRSAISLSKRFENDGLSVKTGLVKTSHPTEIHLAPEGSPFAFLQVPFNKVSKKARKSIATLLGKPWVLGTRIVDQYNLPQSLTNWCIQENIGITINQDIFNSKSTGFIVVIQNGYEEELIQETSTWKESCTLLGMMSDKPEIKLIDIGGTEITLPIDVLRFPWRVFTQTRFHREELKIDKTLPQDIDSKIDELFWKIWAVEGTHDEESNISIEHCDNESKQWVMTSSDNHTSFQDHPRLAGQLAIADASRNLACTGVKPLGLLYRNVFPDSINPEEAWHGFEIIQGQEEAIRSLKLPVLKRSIVSLDEQNIQSIFAVGQRTQAGEDTFSGFQNDGDFISILGSHRGELGYSTYAKLLHDTINGHLPACDLNMESRMQEAVVQGIQAKLIKSAKPLSRGGLAISIGKALKTGANGLGARVHFSRKLRTDQMLFGETQGLILISLGEEDIMEFERICMSIGIPSTTIGRVTDTGRYTFNEFFDIAVDELK
ncbi:MAG: hypothetical protein HQ509_07415 [Candidatus Marinimicrobia bacterium]|nr:hypothetical protein [Candidatus Neomarinimicrobiota bacterium]